jgi:nucleoside-diphosphate-sugar epimerase
VRVLVTGGGGFLGSIIAAEMESYQHKVDVLGRLKVPGRIVADISTGPPHLPAVRYNAIVHAAGRAHFVPRSDAEEQVFFAVNVLGTKNLLAALEHQPTMPDAFVLISTVAVYGLEAGEMLNEDTPRSAEDAYGLSKRQAEDIVLEWGEKRGVRIGIVRLPLVAGHGAPGNLSALISAMRRGRYAGIGDGTARRSMVNACDVAGAVLTIAKSGGTFNLTDGKHPSFIEIEAAVARVLNRPMPRRIPLWVARWGGAVGDVAARVIGASIPLTSRTLTKMTSTLTFDDSRARQQFGWSPVPVLEQVEVWCAPTALKMGDL